MALFAAITLLTGGGGTTADDTPTHDGYNGPGGYIAVDGWSWQMASTDPDAPAPIVVRVEERIVDVAFTPLDEDTLEQFLAADPDAVTKLVARLVDPDPSLRCDADGCSTDSGDIDTATILDPASVNPILKDAGVETLAYVAPLNPRHEHVVATIDAPIGYAIMAPEDPAALAGRQDIDENGNLIVYPEPDPDNPVWEVAAIGAAWGQVFPLETPHIKDPNYPDDPDTPYGTAVFDSAEELDRQLDPAPFTQGLSVDDQRLNLTSSQLTAWSWPLIGCGPGVVCAATAEDYLTSSEVVESTQTCRRSEFETLDGEHEIVDSFDLITRTVTITAPNSEPVATERDEMWAGDNLVGVAPHGDNSVWYWVELDLDPANC